MVIFCTFNTYMVIVLLLSSLHLEFSWCSPAWCDRARLLGSWPNLSRESPLALTSLCPETTCPPPASQNPPALRSSFQSKTYFSTAPIIVLACTSPIRVSTCRGAGRGPEKNFTKIQDARYSSAVLCISVNWWRRSTVQKYLSLSFERSLLIHAKDF